MSDSYTRCGLTSIKTANNHYWFPTLPAEGDKVKILLPVEGNKFTLIESVDDLVNWFFDAFPNAVMAARQVKPVGIIPVQVKHRKYKEIIEDGIKVLCPHCNGDDIHRNGYGKDKSRRFFCLHCRKTFTMNEFKSKGYDPLNT